MDIDKSYCIRYKERNNPSWKKIDFGRKYKFISDLTLEFSSLRYFVEKTCFANGYTDYLDYFNFPNIEVADDNSKLFLLKLYKIYELKKYKMFFMPLTSEKYKNTKSCFIYTQHTDLDNLILYAFLRSITLQNFYKNLYLTKEDMMIINSILISYEYQFEKEENRWIIFNGFLRENIINGVDFYKKIGNKLTRENFENLMEKEFKEMKKKDHKFMSNMHKQFDLLFSSFLQKIHRFQKTPEYKKFYKQCLSTVAPFKFPLKEYFGKNHPIQYNCFNNLLKQFTKEYKTKKINF